MEILVLDTQQRGFSIPPANQMGCGSKMEETMDTSSIFRIQILITGFVLFGAATAKAQNDRPATFTATIQQKLDARSDPAKVTTEDEGALTSKGYVMIGTIKATQPGNKTSAEITEALRAAALSKAAGAGGDVVHFEREGAAYVEWVRTGKMLKLCRSYGTATYKVMGTDPRGPAYGHVLQTKETSYCKDWDSVPDTKADPGVVSEGTVWRHDPELASDIARAKARKEASDMELLLAHVNAWDNDGRTPLYAAAAAGKKEVAELLLAHGADVNAGTRSGETPLGAAARAGNREVAELLLAHGADVNAKDNTGETPLLYAAIVAAIDRRNEVVELLLAHGADVNAKDNTGDTPLKYAKIYKEKELVELLRRHGAHN
jgi:hypothetical protein